MRSRVVPHRLIDEIEAQPPDVIEAQPLDTGSTLTHIGRDPTLTHIGRDPTLTVTTFAAITHAVSYEMSGTSEDASFAPNPKCHTVLSNTHNKWSGAVRISRDDTG